MAGRASSTGVGAAVIGTSAESDRGANITGLRGKGKGNAQVYPEDEGPEKKIREEEARPQISGKETGSTCRDQREGNTGKGKRK